MIYKVTFMFYHPQSKCIWNKNRFQMMYKEFYDKKGKCAWLYGVFPSINASREVSFILHHQVKFYKASGKTSCHRNITDLFAARFTTLNINVWHQNIKYTVTVTIQMGVYSFPYLNVKNAFFFFFFFNILMLQECALSGFGTFTNPPKTATIKRKRPQTAQVFFFFSLKGSKNIRYIQKKICMEKKTSFVHHGKFNSRLHLGTVERHCIGTTFK